MERRFQTLIIDPPSKSEAIEILTGLRDGFEAHHRVRITDDAIHAAVELSSRYITGRFLPDKAIDVLDEACSRERLARTTKPPDVTSLESDILRLEREKDHAVHSQDFELAAKIRDQLEKLKQRKEDTLHVWKKSSKEIDGAVDAGAVAETISTMTGIPSSNLREEDTARLAKMEEILHQMVVSQDAALDTVCRAIRRSRAGLKDPDRPLGSFIFVGPSGVGKTLLAKALAKFLFGNEDALIALDMSEYMEKHSISRLVGSPPGYVGYEEGGQLTEKIRRKPYSVVLLDEIEKAHGDFSNLLLQVLEEGRLTDSFGRTIDFKNTILIMTSNLGVGLLNEQSSLGFRTGASPRETEKQREVVRAEIEAHFRPEFLNRLDAIVTFDYLSLEAVERIFDLELKKLERRLDGRRIRVEVDRKARDFLIQAGYSERTGARGIRRVIEERIEDPLSEMIILGQIHNGGLARIEMEGGSLRFRVAAEK
jgi:ATP-dependent Clp protease ATP-binding subunit ClpC